MYEITTVTPTPQAPGSECGFCAHITGTNNGQPFSVNIWCEYDGRDVEFENAQGIDPDADMDFFDQLCMHQPFTDAMNAGYQEWEKQFV